MVARRKEGGSWRELGREFGLAQSTVRNAVNGFEELLIADVVKITEHLRKKVMHGHMSTLSSSSLLAGQHLSALARRTPPQEEEKVAEGTTKETPTDPSVLDRRPPLASTTRHGDEVEYEEYFAVLDEVG